MFGKETEGSEANHSTVKWVYDFSDGPLPEFLPYGSSDPFFSISTRILLEKVLKCYTRNIIVFIGIPANILCCVVFVKQGLSDRINLLLFWLAMADLVNLSSQLLAMVDCFLVDTMDMANWATLVHSKIGYANWWTGFVSGTLMVIVSVDRCLSVAVPFKAKRILTYRSMIAAIFLCYAVPLVFVLPRFLSSTVEWRVSPLTNRSIAYVVPTEWFYGDGDLSMEILNAFILITRPTVLVTMIVCCAITIFHLRRASEKRQEMVGTVQEKGEAGERKITKMLLLLCFVYVVFLVPDVCKAIAIRIFPDYFVMKKYHNTYFIVVCFLWVASCMNSTVNFFVYVVLSSRFQRTLKELLQCCVVQKTTNN